MRDVCKKHRHLPSLETARSYLAPAVPGSIPLFYLFLLLLPLFRGGGLRKVLGLAELLGSLRHGAAATVAAAAPVTVAPALLSFALPPVVPVSSSLCPPSPVAYYLFSGGHHDMCVYKAGSGNVCVQNCMYVDGFDATAATRQPPAATKKDATASGADAACLCRGCYSSSQLALR